MTGDRELTVIKNVLPPPTGEVVSLLFVCVSGEMSCSVHYFKIKDLGFVATLCPTS